MGMGNLIPAIKISEIIFQKIKQLLSKKQYKPFNK